MAKTKRVIKECLAQVDIVFELIDARIPFSSQNPDINDIIGDKPKLIIMTKATLADPEANKMWLKHYESLGENVILVDSVTGYGMDSISESTKKILREKLEKYKTRGMDGRKLRAMIVGIPNVGKSSLINKLAGSKKAKVENRPGVTLNKQWVPTDIGLDLLDTPGVLWPKFEDENVGLNLAATGAIKDAILDTEELAMLLAHKLLRNYEKEFTERYRLDSDEALELDSYDLLGLVGRKRGFLMSGGEINYRRTAEMLLEEFRSAKIGKITLELPKNI